MKFSDINVRHVYNVNFEPHMPCEFDRTHLAVVLKKNNDNRTCIVAPLTSDDNGDGVNKFNVGKLSCLPINMQVQDSYVVFNQVRTVNHNRFMSLRNDLREKIQCEIDTNIFNKIMSLCTDELCCSLDAEEKYNLFIEKSEINASELLINAAYEIKRALNESDNEILLTSLQNKIIEIMKHNFDYDKHLSEIDNENGVSSIINICLKHNIIKHYKEILIEKEGQAK